MNRDDHKQLAHLLRPIATRLANMIARAVVQLADDGGKLQQLQLGVLAGETVDNAEHHQPYGFSSVPLAGAEAVVVFPNGDRSHPLVVASSDRRYRPTRGEDGQVTMYHYSGSTVTMLASGDIVMKPGPGGQVKVDDGGGSPRALAFNDDLTTLITAIEGAASGNAIPGPSGAVATAFPSSPAGTAVLQAK